MKTQAGFISLAVFGLSLLCVAARADAPPGAVEAPDYKTFPIGIFDINTEDDLDAAKKLGCNFVETRASSVTDSYTAKAKSLDLAVVPFLLNGKMAIESIPQQLATLHLDRFQDQGIFPAIFPIDEPSGGRVPPQTVAATYQQLRGILAQPQICLLNRVLETANYFDGYDILALDPYPVFYKGTVGGRLSTVSQEVDLAKKANGNKPIWMALQAFGQYGGWQRAPRGDELRAMAGLAVTHGAQGLWYYTWNADNVPRIQMIKQLPDLQDAIRGISSDMAFVAPLLNGPTNDLFRVHGPAHVRILTKDDLGAVLVAHSGYDARVVTVSSSLFQGAQLTSSDAAVQLNAGKLTVKFPSCGFEVVRLKLGAPSSTPIDAALSIDPEAAPEFVLNDIASISASSNAPGDQGGAYREWKMGDGSLNDNWASARNYQLPIKVRVSFEQPKTLSQVVIYPMIMTGHPGYDAWGDTQILTSDGQSIEKTFTEDDHGPYTFDLKPGKLDWFEVDIKTTLSKTDYIGCREIEIH